MVIQLIIMEIQIMTDKTLTELADEYTALFNTVADCESDEITNLQDLSVIGNELVQKVKEQENQATTKKRERCAKIRIGSWQ